MTWTSVIVKSIGWVLLFTVVNTIILGEASVVLYSIVTTMMAFILLVADFRIEKEGE